MASGIIRVYLTRSEFELKIRSYHLKEINIVETIIRIIV